MSTLQFTGKLVIQDCCACGMTFAVTAEFDRRRLDDHQAFYCPAGHRQSYTGPTDAQRQRKYTDEQRERADRLERRLANAQEDARAANASRIALKGQLTKTKNRVANGVCPCCNRSFVDLGRHMAGQHPDYAEASK